MNLVVCKEWSDSSFFVRRVDDTTEEYYLWLIAEVERLEKALAEAERKWREK